MAVRRAPLSEGVESHRFFSKSETLVLRDVPTRLWAAVEERFAH